MKKLFVFAAIIFAAISVKAQQNPVAWTFTAKKVADKTYEIHMTATIQTKWHLYSQKQPDDAVVNPTTFAFSPNPLFKLDDKTKEVGKMEDEGCITRGICPSILTDS